MNHKKVQRLWREEGLRVVVKRRRKRAGSSTVPPVPTATGPNMVWAIDFQFDSSTDGRPIKILSVVDEHTRECLGGLVERSITAEILADELDQIAYTRGANPAVLRLDNGPEMIAAALAQWAGTRTGMLFIPPGEPWRNPFIESLNGRLRDECLNIHLFWSLTHARVTISDWKDEYNHDRPQNPRSSKLNGSGRQTRDHVQRSQVQILPPLQSESAGQRRFPERSGSRLWPSRGPLVGMPRGGRRAGGSEVLGSVLTETLPREQRPRTS